MIIPYLQFLLILLTILCFVVCYRNYRIYYEYLKSDHMIEFTKLIKKDNFIDAVGEWIRWPAGSAWLLLSILNLEEDYGDITIACFKKKILIYFLIAIGLFVISLLLSLGGGLGGKS